MHLARPVEEGPRSCGGAGRAVDDRPGAEDIYSRKHPVVVETCLGDAAAGVYAVGVYYTEETTGACR